MCATVAGTRAVWLVERADPTVVSRPADGPSNDELPVSLTGPDATGRLYMAAGPALGPTDLYRSDDAGCTWSVLGPLPGDTAPRLFTSRVSPRLYVDTSSGLYVTEDGITLTLSTADPGPVSVVVGGAPDHLWGYDADGIVESADGGLTWVPQQPFVGGDQTRDPDFDGSDPPLVASGGSTTLWVWDGVAWNERASNEDDVSVAGWDADRTLWIFAKDNASDERRLLSAVGGADPFVDVGWGYIPDLDGSLRLFAADSGDIATAGLAGIGDGAFVLVRNADGTEARHTAGGFDHPVGLLMLDDVVVVAFQPSGPWIPAR